MRYVALLRGINVGGANTVSMKELGTVFEAAGHLHVRTYINSGNVIFSSDTADRAELVATLQRAMADKFGLTLDVLIRDVAEMTALVEAIPAEWANDDHEKTDVFFLWPDVDRPTIADELGARPGIDEVRYVPGAVIRRVERANATKSGLLGLIGKPLYKRMTLRNVNTTRKLLELMQG